MLKREIPWGVGGDPHRVRWARVHWLEYKLILRSDEAFNEAYTEHTKRQFEDMDGPIVTGDPVIDKLEREVYENAKKGKRAVPNGF